MYLRLRMIYLSIKRDPKNRAYSDLALTPIDDDEIATWELFRNEAAQACVSRERRLKGGAARPDGWFRSMKAVTIRIPNAMRG